MSSTPLCTSFGATNMLLPRGKYKTLLLKIDKRADSIFKGDAAISVGAFAKTVGVVAISVKLFLHLCDLSLVSFASV